MKYSIQLIFVVFLVFGVFIFKTEAKTFCIQKYWDYYGVAWSYDNNVMVVGGCGGGSGAQIALFSSTFGDSNKWTDVSPPEVPFPRLWNLYDVIYTEKDGWVSSGAIAAVLRSSNNGGKWAQSPDPVGPPSLKQSFFLNKAIYVNGQYLVVGDAGTLFTSTDLTGNWTFVSQIRQDLTHQFLYGIEYTPANGGLYVIVGGQLLDEGPIIYSNDSITWYSANKLPFYNYLADVAYGNNVWVAVGSTSYNPNSGDQIGVILYSYDGIDWRLGLNETTLDTKITAVAYGNGLFVAVGRFIYSSKDGINWKKATKQPDKLTSTSWLRDVVVTPKGMLAVGNANKIWYSKDGLNWFSRTKKS